MSGVYALVLAAGSGARFGGGKLLAPWRGGVLLGGALAAATCAPVAGVIVVLGAEAQAVGAAVQAFVARAASPAHIRTVHAQAHAEGLSASLRAGLSALPPDASGVLVFLGDMPLVPAAVLAPLVQALADGAPAAAPIHRGRRGNPAAISAALFPALLALDGDRGARAMLDGLGERLVLIETDDAGVLLDVDEPKDMPQ